MSHFLRRSFVLALLSLTSIGAMRSTAAAPPSQMQRIVIRYTEPKPAPNSFAAQPKEYMRAGDQFGRIVEAEDPAMHMHQLLIVNAPDCWMCDLMQKKARHMVTLKDEIVRFPIFPGRGPEAKKLYPLEFGKELDFFKQQHAAKTSAKGPNGQALDQYTFALSADLTVVLNVDSKTSKPLAMTMKSKAGQMTLEYVTYETVPFQESMFKPPAGMQIVEMKIQKKPGVPATAGVIAKPAGKTP